MITKLNQLVATATAKGKKRLAVAFAVDSHTLLAVNDAVDNKIVEATLFGDKTAIEDVCQSHQIDINKFNIRNYPQVDNSLSAAIESVNSGECDILMKGLISTDKYMRAILSSSSGLIEPKSTLSHVAVIELPSYHKLLAVSDVAVIPHPTLEQKITLTKYLISTSKSLGIEIPKVAIIAPSEQVLAKLDSSTDAAIIAKMADRGQIEGAIVDGPLALDVAIDKGSAKIKKLTSNVNSDADCLLFPNIESANVFFKCATKLCGADLAAMVVGAKVPCVLTSRGDSQNTKLYSIALAALSVNK